MVYLLINHVPFGRGTSAETYRVGDLFLQDLRAQAAALSSVGGKLIVATPCVADLHAMSGGSFNTVEIKPADHGFEYVPLPRYLSMKEFLKVRRDLQAALAKAIQSADIVQMDYGGHPVMLGQIAWPIAGRLNKQRIWIFDGADPFPRLELDAVNETNPIKRFAKRIATKRKIAFCREAIIHADLVFSHNAAVVERFKSIWNGHCHTFDRSFVTEEILLTPAELEARKKFLLDAAKPLRVVVAGRQIRIKGTDQVIKSIALLRKQSIPIELDVMGDGDDLGAFKQLADSLQLGDTVRFTGTVPYGQPLFDAWAKSHVMAVTNLTAEISRNVLLSQARGLGLVTYENPGTDALLCQSRSAIIVPRGDVTQLADAFAALHRDRQRLVSLVVAGLQLAASKTLNATHLRRAQLATALIRS